MLARLRSVPPPFLASALFVLGWAVWLPTLAGKDRGDIAAYYDGVVGVLAGGRPYRDVLFEYPPYALVFTLLPGLIAPSFAIYRAAFSLLMLGVDAVIRMTLWHRGRASAFGAGALWGMAIFTFAGVCAQYLYLKRFDVLPVAVVLLATLALLDERFGSAGALLAVAVGLKIYPIVLGPLWLVRAWRRGGLRQVIVGGLIGLAPLAVLACWLPFWKMFAFHLTRGMEAESQLGGLAWLLFQGGVVHATWIATPRWFDVGGPFVEQWTSLAHAAWYVSSLGSAALGVALVARRAATRDDVLLAAWLALLGFVTFNIVLSPQYMLWLAGALAVWLALSPNAVRDQAATIGFFALAVVLTALVFPSKLFTYGIGVGTAFALFTRNLLLIGMMITASATALRRMRA